jgi:hypothetical protein
MSKIPTVPVLVNYERARGILDILLDAYRRKIWPYHQKSVQGTHNLPESLEWGSKEHAIFLFCVCYYMKGGIKSSTAIKAVSRVWNKHPELFLPERFLEKSGDDEDIEIEKITKILMNNGLGANANETARNWVKNSQKLAKFWEGDPRLLFREVKLVPGDNGWTFDGAQENFDRLCKNFLRPSSKKWDPLQKPEGFYGFRHKMVSMLAYFFIDAGMISPFPYPVPVDFHVLRIHTSTDSIYAEVTEGRAFSVARASKAARETTLRYAVETQTPPEHIADALWYLSNTYCVRHPDNGSKIGEYAARDTEVDPKEYKWTDTRTKTFMRTCGRCPILANCKWSVPPAYYYRKGILVVRGKRSAPVDAVTVDIFAGWNPV